jgi:hypothetical protein
MHKSEVDADYYLLAVIGSTPADGKSFFTEISETVPRIFKGYRVT